MEFRAAPSRGGWIGLGLVAAAVSLEAALVGAAVRVGLGPAAAAMGLVALTLLPVVGWLATWLWGYRTLGYSLSRDALVIRWGPNRQVVPMQAITHVLAGRPYAAPLRGLRWPGHEIGRTQIAGDDGERWDTLVYASTGPEGQLVVVTPEVAYAISPADRAAFIEDFKVRRRLGPTQRIDQSTDRPAWARLSLWRDGLLLGIAVAGLALNALAFAWLVWHYPSLPGALALQFRYDPVLEAAASGPARPLAAAWTLPAFALTAWAVDLVLAGLVHRRARLAALLLVGGGAAVQLAVAVVVVRLGSM